MTWQDLWEEGARDEFDRFSALPLAELLRYVEIGYFGNYYRLWYAIAAKNDAVRAGPVLFASLTSDAEYLQKYHCAQALLSLLGISGIQPVDLALRETANHDRHMGEVRAKLDELIRNRLPQSP